MRKPCTSTTTTCRVIKVLVYQLEIINLSLDFSMFKASLRLILMYSLLINLSYAKDNSEWWVKNTKLDVPKVVNLLSAKSIKLIGKKKYKEAISVLTQAIKIKKNMREFGNRGFSYIQIDKYEDAIKDYKEVFKLKLDHPKLKDMSDLYTQIGMRLMDIMESGKGGQNEVNLAFSYFDKAIGVNKKNYLLYSELGFAYSRMGAFENCIDIITKSITLNSENLGSYLNRAGCYIQTKQMKKAEADIEAAYKIDPKAEMALMWKISFSDKKKECNKVKALSTSLVSLGKYKVEFIKKNFVKNCIL